MMGMVRRTPQWSCNEEQESLSGKGAKREAMSFGQEMKEAKIESLLYNVRLSAEHKSRRD